MRNKFVLFFSLLSFAYLDASLDESKLNELRILSKKAQNDEKAITKLNQEIKFLEEQEEASAPMVKSVYGVLTKCFTLLYNIERYAPILKLSQLNNSTDYVRCSMIIKNFEIYFDKIKDQLGKNSNEILIYKQKLKNEKNNFENVLHDYKQAVHEIDKISEELTENRDENSIQNDIVYHIAAKSESLEELDAELEAENTLGVFKDIKISTKMSLDYPVAGKLIEEFGDKIDGEMNYATSFETCEEAIVTSPTKGIVLFVGPFLNYGNMVIISNGEYRVFLYGLDKIFVFAGDIVDIGSYIGKMSKKKGSLPILKLELKRSGEALDAHDMILETSRKENI